jgi:Tfp pilus assembly protein PilX
MSLFIGHSPHTGFYNKNSELQKSSYSPTETKTNFTTENVLQHTSYSQTEKCLHILHTAYDTGLRGSLQVTQCNQTNCDKNARKQSHISL